MNCPRCEKKMTAGYLHSHHHLVWSEKRQTPVNRRNRANIWFRLRNPFLSFFGARLMTWCCRDCGTMVTRFGESEVYQQKGRREP